MGKEPRRRKKNDTSAVDLSDEQSENGSGNGRNSGSSSDSKKKKTTIKDALEEKSDLESDIAEDVVGNQKKTPRRLKARRNLAIDGNGDSDSDKKPTEGTRKRFGFWKKNSNADESEAGVEMANRRDVKEEEAGIRQNQLPKPDLELG
jgi:hypothetical protein